ncbi:DUF1566 domain-containing protein [Leptospira adleri]|uniref:Lcl C-terminal domain-containing protein n=1 Tax=Leptospira adleri TaxID=2023186 RepID=A0A2M9YMK5_9LEPT|nr:DUF1566 domain-containing protein [Leptospira adleri]PJZ52771.1 hypothetical protein CH380_13560 [Leptospira adleri]PJZ60303.1 hypothetical protein CH376_19120 [Leptospira adleri]TGM57181.1 DUF1566 domain-containing protein [Leptospira adleri]
MFRRSFFIILFFFLIFCGPGKEPYNPAVPYSQAWKDTEILKCLLLQTPECNVLLPNSDITYFPEKIPDTGQTICYDTTTNIPCSDPTYTRQDADFVNISSARSYTGPTAHSVYTNDYTTFDNIRGLTWKTCPDGLSGPTCATGAAISSSFSVAPTVCSALNSLNSGNGYAGIKTWRLPSIYELARFGNTENPNGVDSANFPGNPAVSFYSSTPYASNPTTTGWFVQMTAGFYNQLNFGTGPFAVRCVSGASLQSSSLTNNGNGTVTDNRTGLVWQTSGSSIGTWQQALSGCASLSLAGLSWRLPNVTELHSIADYSGSTPAINATFFPGTVSQYHWTSTTDRSNLTYAWSLFFTNGLIGGNGKAASWYYRCVSGP